MKKKYLKRRYTKIASVKISEDSMLIGTMPYNTAIECGMIIVGEGYQVTSRDRNMNEVLEQFKMELY